MKIEWVNHASYVLEAGPVRLIADPWIEGRAFDDGWAHLVLTRFRFEDFANITHIWFSHEHPDHFSPGNLRKIPEAERKSITVLYQKTRDRKVAQFCEKAGFGRVVELPHGEWFTVAPGFDVLCRPAGNDDSWLAVRAKGQTLLNLNDCIVRSESQCAEIRRLIGDAQIDVLLTQFSYASWAGNPGDAAAHRREADEKLRRIQVQTTSLRPRYVIPFASFVWFCHEENWFHNEGANGVGEAWAAIEATDVATGVVLFPGDTWDVGTPHDALDAIERYRPHYERVFAQPTLVRQTPVPVQKLRADAAAWVQRLRRRNGWLFRVARWKNPFPAARIDIADHGVTAEFTLERGLEVVANAGPPCDIALTSSALSYCFQHEWGGGTLAVNGRYSVPAGGDAARFHLYFELAEANNRGVTYPSLFRQRIASRLGL